MILSDPRWDKFIAEPNSLDYRGFELKITEKDFTGTFRLTFSDGQNEIVVSGGTKREAFRIMFDKIDKYFLTE